MRRSPRSYHNQRDMSRFRLISESVMDDKLSILHTIWSANLATAPIVVETVIVNTCRSISLQIIVLAAATNTT